MIWKDMIYGELSSKSNSRQIVKFGDKLALIKSAKARNYYKDFVRQTGIRSQPILGDVKLTAHIYYATRRPDLDVSLLMDCLQRGDERNPGACVIENDRQVKEIHAYHHLDPDSPRVEVEIEELKKGGLA